ncbi:MAG: hypothetical protein ACI8P9_004871, partial [Parasphingorhabdus sp.]
MQTTETVSTPLPGIPCHVIKAIIIWREAGYRSNALKAILPAIVIGEFSLPDIATMLT